MDPRNARNRHPQMAYLRPHAAERDATGRRSARSRRPQMACPRPPAAGHGARNQAHRHKAEGRAATEAQTRRHRRHSQRADHSAQEPGAQAER